MKNKNFNGLAKVKNNAKGRHIIKLLRKTGIRIKLRGRGHRMGIKSYRQDLPLKYATTIAIYPRA